MHSYFNKYPVFWQWFIYAFGGFILLDLQEDEYKLISRKTGIPINEIDNAFKAYECLFPIENGWFEEIPNTNIKTLKLFSVPFMGVGANFRRYHYLKTKDFEEFSRFVNGKYTLRVCLNFQKREFRNFI